MSAPVHWPVGPSWQDPDRFAGRCRCGVPFEGRTREEAELAWLDHLAPPAQLPVIDLPSAGWLDDVRAIAATYVLGIAMALHGGEVARVVVGALRPWQRPRRHDKD